MQDIADYTLNELMNLTLVYEMRSFKCMAGQTAKHPYRKWFSAAECVTHHASSTSSATWCYWFSHLNGSDREIPNRPTFISSIVISIHYWSLCFHCSNITGSVLFRLAPSGPAHPFRIPPPLFLFHLTRGPVTQPRIKAPPPLLAAQINLRHSA